MSKELGCERTERGVEVRRERDYLTQEKHDCKIRISRRRSLLKVRYEMGSIVVSFPSGITCPWRVTNVEIWYPIIKPQIAPAPKNRTPAMQPLLAKG